MSNKVKASEHESYGTYTLIAFFIPIVGIILGIVYLAKDKAKEKKLGEHLIAISILFIILQSILIGVFWGNWFRSTTYNPAVSSVVNSPVVSSWDPSDYYDKVKTGDTKAEVEKITGKQSKNCIISEDSFTGSTEICDYGEILTDKGVLNITYLNGKLYNKTKISL